MSLFVNFTLKMTNLITPSHNIMNASSSSTQTDRKRKASARSTSCSSLDTDSDDDQTEMRKIARISSQLRISRVEHSSNTEASSSVRRESSSESDSESSEKCPICLRPFKFQTLSIPDTCSHHVFCLSCLEEWSKSRKTCPVDRKEYTSILVLDAAGNVCKQVPLKSITTEAFGPWPPPYEPTFCEVCGLFTNEQEMLICDGCGTGYHLYCLMPHMENRPTGVWLCHDCWYYYNY